MKLRSILCGVLALAATVACKPDEPVVEPSLDLSKTSALVAAEGEEITVEVTANVDWTASADQDWVSVSPASGKGSDQAASVKVNVAANETYDSRAAVVTVAAGTLSKTLKITQTGADQPEPETYVLVGEAVGGWDVDADGVILTLKDGYYVAKAVSVTAKKGMHFTKNNKWEGNVKGKHGLIAPNEIGEVGGNDISLTEGGKFDVYLTEALDKFYFMSEGKLPSEAVEHVDIAVTWGVCGAIDGNGWGASADPEMTQEGEWYVAKGIVFTEVNFKVRGNNSWSDDVKWGRAAEDQICELNKAIAVLNCTDYKAANPSAGDNPNIYIGGAGTYDVYFSPDKKEVWVMNPGLKPGDEAPEVEKTYTVTGTIKGTDTDKKANYWNPSNEPGLMTLEGNYYVAKGVEFDYDYRFSDDASGEDYVKFKICETGTWNAFGQLEEKVVNEPNAEIAVQMGGQDIYISQSGVYDVYLDKDNGKVWVMEAGYAPGEEPARLDGYQWLADLGGMQVLCDFGLMEEGALVIALPAEDGSGFNLYQAGIYEVDADDAQSGIIIFFPIDLATGEEGEIVEAEYSDLTATSVNILAPDIFGIEDAVPFTRVETPYEINMDAVGGEDPQGVIENGEYWIIETAAAVSMKPLSGNYGYPEAGYVLAENGTYASTAENAFTFTYLPDYSYYTIQDSNGKCLYMKQKNDGSWYNSFNVGEYVEGDPHFHWCIEDLGNGTYDIYNEESGYQIAYSSSYGSWGAYATGSGNALPTLVKAENPVEEPVAESLYVEWLFSEEAMSAYKDTFGGTDGKTDKNAGDGGMYVAANASGQGKISYVQIDKNELDVDGKAMRIVGGTGHPYVIGIWPGDYWLFEATDGTEYPAGTKVNISYITRTSKTGHKYWRLEYLDGTEWKAAMETSSYTLNGEEFNYNIAMFNDGKKNVEVDATVTLSSATKDIKFRMLCVANGQSSNEATIEKPNGGTCRIAGASGTSPVIKVVE